METPLRKNKLSVRDLDVRYAAVHAVKSAALDIAENRVTALIGASGCGKSTFLRALNRMHDLAPGVRVSGSVMLDGVDLYAPELDPVAVRQQVGMVFQRPHPFAMSIYENVAYGARIHGVRSRARLDAIVERSLARAGMWEEVRARLNRPATDLAEGDQQRLCIARTLAVAPKVILMDEPASALDPIATAKIEDLIGALKAEYTVVIVTHSMQQAARLADDIAFFHLGEIIETGAAAELFMRPKQRKTEDYITGRFG